MLQPKLDEKVLVSTGICKHGVNNDCHICEYICILVNAFRLAFAFDAALLSLQMWIIFTSVFTNGFTSNVNVYSHLHHICGRCTRCANLQVYTPCAPTKIYDANVSTHLLLLVNLCVNIGVQGLQGKQRCTKFKINFCPAILTSYV